MTDSIASLDRRIAKSAQRVREYSAADDDRSVIIEARVLDGLLDQRLVLMGERDKGVGVVA